MPGLDMERSPDVALIQAEVARERALRTQRKRALAALPAEERRRVELYTQFYVADLDGSGGIDLDEFRQLAQDLCVPLSERRLRQAFAALDRDGSGQLDFEEFRAWFDSEGGPAKSRRRLGAMRMVLRRSWRARSGKTDKRQVQRGGNVAQLREWDFVIDPHAPDRCAIAPSMEHQQNSFLRCGGAYGTCPDPPQPCGGI